MRAEYPTIYRDKAGEATTTIHNDGRILSMVVRGVEFRGTDFDSLMPADGTDPSLLPQFRIHQGCLCSCAIQTSIPIPIASGQGIQSGVVSLHLELGEPTSRGLLDAETLMLTLSIGDEVVRSGGESGWFEDELLDIQKQMPNGKFIKCCFNCAFSDYSPYGHGLFGALACFRENRNAYLAVKAKDDLFRIWNSMTEFVQETYLCPEFQRRVPGTGYRG